MGSSVLLARQAVKAALLEALGRAEAVGVVRNVLTVIVSTLEEPFGMEGGEAGDSLMDSLLAAIKEADEWEES